MDREQMLKDRTNTIAHSLGMEFVEISKGKVVMTMPVDERTRQPHGFLHGGASVALAETAASVGTAYLIDEEKEICFGLEINANHIKAKREGTVTAVATIAHQGRTTMVWEIHIRDEEGALICLSRCTVAVMPKKK
ncbi:ComA operon protein 2 [Bacillus thermotolerans]|uniref:ComA operon protein 2 n=2 Tax=Bacillus thermotolerans TaxID=1221996 RepID=A0A0F5I8S7_BACTR|nr:hotdog fold thioesterase [Bacillus thermotolerans]KKB40605.1 ComA operon protein 2 [Bacillus thermotolerans]KKB41941.1 ComA operon protein 2 [Bacillus thermotolerans]